MQKIQQQWASRKMQQDSEQMQKHADDMHMEPTGGYAKIHRANNNKHHPLLKPNGTKTNNRHEITERLAEHIQTHFQTKNIKPSIHHIPEKIWETINEQNHETLDQHIRPDIQHSREKPNPAKLMQTHPYIEHWLDSKYTEKGERTLLRLKKNKAHGSDGIPGEAYKTLSP